MLWSPGAVMITELDKEGSSRASRDFSITTVSGRSMNINNNQTKVSIKPQSSVFAGDTVTLSCEGRLTERKIIWYKDFQTMTNDDRTLTLRDVGVSNGGKYACGVLHQTIQSPRVTLSVRVRPKPVARVHPDGRALGGQTVTLTCELRETDVSSWTYSWNKDDSPVHASRSPEYRIGSVDESHAGRYSCAGHEIGGSRHSHTSDEVTLSVSGPSMREPLFNVLLVGVISGLSGAFLLIFILALLFCCRRNKGGRSLSPSPDRRPPTISQTPTPSGSGTVNGTSRTNYVEVNMKSMEETKKKNKGEECYDHIYSKLSF
ncbi:sialoadhesin-like isoform X2 [Puntigrus tetrazona]|uniref:sialoadhesin-like isoform X2 n=1 Tax=Puntigrus tetrazona TaxID=1606681 RepID=UPI001C8985A3|nr:sialoadhesin-like isoform X2 [Puntigrus tetrazona]